LVIALGCLLSQLSLGFKFDELHKIFNDQIALEFFGFLFGKRAVMLCMDEFVCSFSHLGRGMESHDLFRSWMMREKLCNFSCGLCFEKHNDFLLLKRIEWFVLDDPLRAYQRRDCVAKTRGHDLL
jgi:hypothetical protein